MGRLRPLPLRRVYGVVTPGAASTVHYGTELNTPGEPVAPKSASVHSVGAALHWSFVGPGSVGRFSTFRSLHEAEIQSRLAFYAQLDLVRVVPCDNCLMTEYVLASVVAIDASIFVFPVRPFTGTQRSSVSASSQAGKIILHVLMLCRGFHKLSQGAVIRRLLARERLDEPAPHVFHLLP